MRKRNVTKVLAAMLACVLLCSALVVPSAAATESGSNSGGGSYSNIAAILGADSYSEYISEHVDDDKGETEIAADVPGFVATGTEEAIYPAAIVSELKAMLDAKESKSAEDNEMLSALNKLVDMGCGDESVYLPESGNVSFSVNVPEGSAGLYGIRFEYYPIEGNISTIERKLFIDDEVLFAEAYSLIFSKLWGYEYVDLYNNTTGKKGADGIADYLMPNELKTVDNSSFQQDLNGNDLRPGMYQTPEWYTYECHDSNGFVNGAFEFYFSEGTHTISLEAVREAMVVRSIELFPVEETSYADYSEANMGKPSAGASSIFIQAETPDVVSDTSVYAANDRSSNLTFPSDPGSQRFNVIGKNSCYTIGQWAAYNFTCEKSGYYNIVLRCLQSKLEGMFVSRTVKIWSSDGKYGTTSYDAEGNVIGKTPTVPFTEAYNARVPYSGDWQVLALGDGNDTFEFYFEEGVEYQICFEVGLGELSDVIGTVDAVLTTINNCYLEILKLTGAEPDQYRDYDFGRVMPATIRELQTASETLYEVSEYVEEICGTKGAHLATLNTVAELLERMGSDEDEIAANLGNLKNQIGSLGTWLNNSKSSMIFMDYIAIMPIGSEMPRTDVGFFESIWFEIQAFFTSFFTDYDSMGVTSEAVEGESVEVWLAYGRDQSQIWRNLVDSSFTPQTGVPVSMKLVTATTLLPSILAGQGPDVYIGLASNDVINYAIRGAILPIDGFEDFDDTIGFDFEKSSFQNGIVSYVSESGEQLSEQDVTFNYSSLIPLSTYTVNEKTKKVEYKTYGMPETSSFNMLYVREDVLADLGEVAPRTWDEMLEMLPVLQSNNMEIGIGYEGALHLRIYQSGSSIWKYEDIDEYAGAQINYDSDVALDSFEWVCRLYTDYSFPYTYDPSNRFRTGEMPLVVSDYVSLYNTLTVFATEIRGLWHFTSVPGTETTVIRQDENGEDYEYTYINNVSTTGVTATVMLKGADSSQKHLQDSWAYVKWQGGADVQAQYGNEMVALVGPAAKYATANMKAVKDLSWTSSEYEALMSQFYNLAGIGNYPGSYIRERYLKFAFLDAYNDGADPSDSLEDNVEAINKELTRKRQEFGLKVLETGQKPEGVE